jgi:hypothetical protein
MSHQPPGLIWPLLLRVDFLPAGFDILPAAVWSKQTLRQSLQGCSQQTSFLPTLQAIKHEIFKRLISEIKKTGA